MSTALTSYPFSLQSVGESQWNAAAKWFVGSGVRRHELNELEVFADSSGMQVKVKTGRLWAYAQFGELSAQTTVAIAASSATQNRIDRIVIRVDWALDTTVLDVLTGTPGASPAAPALTRSGTQWEFSLAQIAVDAAVTTIAAGKVTDERNNAAYCGYSYSPFPCQPCLSTTRPATFEVGGLIFETDTSKVYVNVGTATVPSWTQLTTTTTSFAAPALTLSTTNAAGAASTAIRTDATILVFDATTPSTQAIGDTGTVGVATTAPRRDHKHVMPTFETVPSTQAYGDAAAPGTAVTIPRGDHKHGFPAASTVVTETGTAVVVSNTVVETTLFTTTITANSMSTDKKERLTVHGTTSNHSGGQVAFTIKAKFGAKTLTMALATMDEADWSFKLVFEVANKHATNSQFLSAWMVMSNTIYTGLVSYQWDVTDTGALDTTAGVTMAVTVTMGTASANYTTTMHHSSLELA